MTFLRRFRKDQQGAVAAEFVILLPLVLSVFMASFEAGYAMVRIVMLERGLDLVVRDLRLGHLGRTPDHDTVRAKLCDYYMIMPNCESDLNLEMQLIDRTTWTGFNTPATCVDRATQVVPPLSFTQGTSNEVVTVRACAVFDPFFPTTSMGLRLPLDASGGYQLTAMGAFVNEPRE